MSFRVKGWSDQFSESFYERATTLLTAALNKGTKHSMIADHITVKELDLGPQPPQLEILEVGDLAPDRFQGLFNLHYSGDASLVLQTKIRANPLSVQKSNVPSFSSRNTMLASRAPLTVPMFLRLSDLKLNGIVVLVFSKQKGITVVFRNDPLESVRVSSSFDSIPAIARFLQREIEVQLVSLFQEELPSIIYKMSRIWFAKSDSNLSFQKIPFTSPNQSHTSLANYNPDLLDGPPDYHESTKVDTHLPIKMGPLDVQTHPNIRSIASLALSRKALLPISSPSIPMSIYRSTPPDTIIQQLTTQSDDISAVSSPATQYSASDYLGSNDTTARPSIFGRSHGTSQFRRRERVKKRHVIKIHEASNKSASSSETFVGSKNVDLTESAFDSIPDTPTKIITNINKLKRNYTITNNWLENLQQKIPSEVDNGKVSGLQYSAFKLLMLQRLMAAKGSF
ncbi:ERMES complex subunit, membrane tether and lipid transfer protein Mdm34 [Schizosaccharomyces pombe]|uniref:Mitochondrial distribution and morphology protein 34 n=1 Tax=Schizosaccharomyces pombe (strain 972 / ATCC 24843) TaxID=284812 RepID=MDM34_SCHPO|nr:putative protein Mdm34 [Schizosaccharomyces pombe]Q9UUC9.1 RecName: Full=Mitochondrial distribution and morphology protein 34 [Schizosaccharomyces pombe 972h-]CAB52038.1 mitochondrial outer membrane protein Mdm34 (predicted) [Schizosaccharomyces pombe]|eukprot:NP_595696.1 putative protein Mdm34 [Schizosaccharomyces pombe]